jgi:hypothetical protein
MFIDSSSPRLFRIEAKMSLDGSAGCCVNMSVALTRRRARAGCRSITLGHFFSVPAIACTAPTDLIAEETLRTTGLSLARTSYSSPAST